jgi:very-short-patch-repair endonuclease
MRRYYEPYIKNISRKLRKTMTKEEIILWNKLRRKQLNGLQFYRQKPLGRFVADFYCPAKNLVVEIDGGQHYENGETIKADKEREYFLKNTLKLKVLRFTNIDINKNIHSVMDAILENTR